MSIRIESIITVEIEKKISKPILKEKNVHSTKSSSVEVDKHLWNDGMCWCPMPFRRLYYYYQDLCCPNKNSLNSSLLCQVLSLSVNNQDKAATSVVAGRFSCVLLILYSYHGHMISSNLTMHLLWNFQYGSWMLLSFSFPLHCDAPSPTGYLYDRV